MAGADAVNTTSKYAVQKIAEARRELIGNKIALDPQDNLYINLDIKKSSTC